MKIQLYDFEPELISFDFDNVLVLHFRNQNVVEFFIWDGGILNLEKKINFFSRYHFLLKEEEFSWYHLRQRPKQYIIEFIFDKLKDSKYSNVLIDIINNLDVFIPENHQDVV